MLLTWREPCRVVNYTLLDLRVQLGHTLIVKRNLAADQDIEDNAEAPNVNFRTGVLLGLQQLWRCEVQATTKGFEVAPWRKEITQPKVDNLNISSLAY